MFGRTFTRNGGKMKEDLLKIINHYGVMSQLKYFQSEVFELNEAVIKAEDYMPKPTDSSMKLASNLISHIENIAGEIADCYVMLEQFRQYYGISNDVIKKIMLFKIKRQLERIEEGK